MTFNSLTSNEKNFVSYIDSHIEIMQLLKQDTKQIERACEAIYRALTSGRKCMFAGNGGSASDAQHLAAELVGRFKIDRPALAAISLNTDTSILTACANDFGYDYVFSRQFEAIAKDGDVLILISTSGESPSIIQVLRSANSKGFTTIGLTGSPDSTLAKEAKIPIAVGKFETCFIQEAHIAIGQFICYWVETEMFGR